MHFISENQIRKKKDVMLFEAIILLISFILVFELSNSQKESLLEHFW